MREPCLNGFELRVLIESNFATDIIPPHLAKEPVRNYPLRLPPSDTRVYVVGEKVGQKVFVGQGQPPQGHGHGLPNLRLGDRVAAANAQLEAMNSRVLPERHVVSIGLFSSKSQFTGYQPHEEFDDDELEHLTTRTLAVTRYRRNHELMNQVFWTASRGRGFLEPIFVLSLISNFSSRQEKCRSRI